METKEYIVALHEGVDYDQFWLDMENVTSGLPHIPDRAVSITNDRPVFEQICEYALTDDEAERVRNDPRVYSIGEPYENLPWIEIKSFATQSDNFTKPVNANSNNNFVNWGLPRHSSNVNVYANNSNPSYSYALDGTGVDVIISDSGIQADHPEFTDSNGVSRVYNPGWDTIATQVNASIKTGWDAVSYVTGNNPIDGGHGTHVAGTVAGKTYGWAKNARILSLKSLGTIDGSNISTADVFSMIKYWHQNKGSNRPTVVNMSWGSSISAKFLGITSASQISQVKQAISQITYRDTNYSTNGSINPDSFYKDKGLLIGTDSFTLSSISAGVPYSSTTYDTHINNMTTAGIILVHSAGNSSYKIDISGGADYNNNFIFNLGVFLPGTGIYQFYYNRGSDPKIPITVGSLDSATSGTTDQAATYSMKGPGVDIWSAGTNIMSSWVTNDSASVSYFKNNEFKQKNLQGTSMASPQIAGICALYLQKNPTATPSEVKNWLLTNATNTILNTGTYTDYTNPRSLLGSQPRVAYQNLQAAPTTKSYIKDDTNTWREARAVYIKLDNGTWKQARAGWQKNNAGAWVKIYQL